MSQEARLRHDELQRQQQRPGIGFRRHLHHPEDAAGPVLGSVIRFQHRELEYDAAEPDAVAEHESLVPEDDVREPRYEDVDGGREEYPPDDRE